MQNSNPLTESPERTKWVDALMGSLSLDQKIGQLFVFPFYGTFITPDVKDLIVRHHVGGLRIAQKFGAGMSGHRKAGLSWHEKGSVTEPDDLSFDIPPGLPRSGCTAREFASALNQLRDFALDRPGSVPIHTAFDQEGEGTDFLFQNRLFPHPMGIAKTGDPGLAYRVAKAVGLQTRAMGANMIHSPVVDVNTEPKNPEIGPRAYSEKTEEVIQYALESLRGFQETGLIATAKHYPGRGASDKDAHFGLPTIDMDRESFLKLHVEPYRQLIAAGLPAVMAAFTAYPAFGSSEPAATVPAIITELLKEELGFKGVVTTDNTQMGGLLELYPIEEAIIRCILAGCDLVLCRAYTPVRYRVLEAVNAAVKSGRIPEKRIDDAVLRILAMRWDMGLANNGGKVDAASADRYFNDPEVVGIAEEAAQRSTEILRNRKNLLPLQTAGKRVLLVEQIHHFHLFINDGYAHPGLLWEELLQLDPNIAAVHVNELPTEEDVEAVKRRMQDVDVIISTCYYNYRGGARMSPILDVLKETGKPLVLIANTPYAHFGPAEEFDTVVVSYCPSGRENIRAVAEKILGKTAG